MKVTIFILLLFIFSNCKKIGKKHEINSKWKVEYYIENGNTLNTPTNVSEYYITFNNKKFSCETPINNIGGECLIFKDGEIDITKINRTFISGDSAMLFWENYFVDALSLTSSFKIDGNSILNLNYAGGSIILSKQ